MDLPLIIEPVEFARQLATDSADLPTRLLIVDLSTEEHYQQGHLPGAVHVRTGRLIYGEKPAPGRLPALSQLEEVMGEIGLTPDTHVVVYDDEGGAWAGRFIWTLDVIGHTRYSYLNGGRIAWSEANLPLTTDLPVVERTRPHLQIHPAPIAEAADILASLNQADFRVWDARSPEEYRGEKVLAQKGGHIPGAIHCEFTELMDKANGHRIRADVAAYVAAKGFDASQQIVTHCQTHRRSGLTYLVGKSLGFNIRGYPGSWSEWGNLPDTPVEV